MLKGQVFIAHNFNRMPEWQNAQKITIIEVLKKVHSLSLSLELEFELVSSLIFKLFSLSLSSSFCWLLRWLLLLVAPRFESIPTLNLIPSEVSPLPLALGNSFLIPMLLLLFTLLEELTSGISSFTNTVVMGS